LHIFIAAMNKGIIMPDTLALTIWQNRISPVFDASQTVLIIEAEKGEEISRRKITIESCDPVSKAKELSENGIRELICGAISTPYAVALESREIRLIPFVSGDAQQVIETRLQGARLFPRFRMPGCGRQRHRGQGRRQRGC
jgi:predicted Fe-Mo cluster-binding NifX family protein